MIKHYRFNDISQHPDLRLHIERSLFPERNFETHSHEFVELVIVEHGKCVHDHDGQQYPVKAGDVFLIPPLEVHGYIAIDGLSLCSIGFDPLVYPGFRHDLERMPGYHALFHVEPGMRSTHGSDALMHLSREEIAYVNSLVEPMEEECLAAAPGSEASIHAWFTLLATYLSRRYSATHTPASREVWSLSRVTAYIAENYASEITLDTLAAHAGMSRSTLQRAFRQCYNTTPMRYLLNRRLLRACELLTDRRMSITETAHAVGFNDSNYFTRQFRAMFHMTPRFYKARG